MENKNRITLMLLRSGCSDAQHQEATARAALRAEVSMLHEEWKGEKQTGGNATSVCQAGQGSLSIEVFMSLQSTEVIPSITWSSTPSRPRAG